MKSKAIRMAIRRVRPAPRKQPAKKKLTAEEFHAVGLAAIRKHDGFSDGREFKDIRAGAKYAFRVMADYINKNFVRK
jgi:hypothetical protein